MDWLNVLVITAILIGMGSCKTKTSIITNHTKAIDSHQVSTFKNYPYYMKQPAEEPSILGVFNINDSAAGDEVTLSFLDERNVEITYFDSISTKYISVPFKGKFKKQGYFQIVLERKFLWIPLIYRWQRIKRIRIALTTDDNLILFHKKKEISYSFWLYGFPNKNDRTRYEEGRNSFYFFKKVALNLPEYSSWQ